MSKLALYGAGGLGSWVLELAVNAGGAWLSYDEVFFVDDGPAPPRSGVPVVSFAGLLRESAVADVEVGVCVGDPEARRRIADRVRGAGLGLATLVDPDAKVSPGAALGEGCIVGGRSSVGPGCAVGANSLLLDALVSRGASVGEGCVLDTGCIVCRRASVGDGAYVGPGASVGEGVSVGAASRVAMASAVFEDVAAGQTVGGNPARVLE